MRERPHWKRDLIKTALRTGHRVKADRLIDIRLNANLSRSHFSRLSGFSISELCAWETVCMTVTADVERLYRFYYECSRIFGKDFYLERDEPVTDPTILEWVKEKGGNLRFHPLKRRWQRITRLMSEKSKRKRELLSQGIEPEEGVPFVFPIPRRILRQMEADTMFLKWMEKGRECRP